MKPSLLMRPQNTKHPDLIGKPIEVFKRKSNFLKKETQYLMKFVNTDTNLIKASYLASLRIAKDGKPHTIGETVLLPAAVDMVQAVLKSRLEKRQPKKFKTYHCQITQ